MQNFVLTLKVNKPNKEDCVSILISINFLHVSVYLCVLDGAECNRQFIKMHFKGNFVEQKFVTCNIYTGKPMIFIMYPKVIRSYILL